MWKTCRFCFPVLRWHMQLLHLLLSIEAFAWLEHEIMNPHMRWCMVLMHSAAKYAIYTVIFLLMHLKLFVVFLLLLVTFQLLLRCCVCRQCRCSMQQEPQKLTAAAAAWNHTHNNNASWSSPSDKGQLLCQLFALSVRLVVITNDVCCEFAHCSCCLDQEGIIRGAHVSCTLLDVHDCVRGCLPSSITTLNNTATPKRVHLIQCWLMLNVTKVFRLALLQHPNPVH